MKYGFELGFEQGFERDSIHVKYCIKEDIPLNEFDSFEPSSKRSNAME